MSNLVARVQNILLTPKTEWPVIAAEPETTATLYTKYILILSALGPLAMFLKGTLIGTSTFIGTYRMDMGTGLTMLVLTYLLGLVGIWLWSLIINALAPTFGGQKDSIQALKTAAYAATAAWVGGVAQLIPWIGWLIGLAAAVYSIYLLYLGLPHTMKAPADRAAGYTAVTIVIAIVLSWILYAIVGSVMGRGLYGGFGGPAVTIGDSGFEKGSTGAALEEWAKNMEEAGKQVEQSAEQNAGAPSAAAVGALIGAAVGGRQGVAALPADQIKAFMPETLAGLPRTSLSAQRNAAMGFEVAEASADYSDGAGRNLKLEINDTGGAQGLLGLAAWANVEEDREWQGGYEKTYRDSGRMIHERWDSTANRGEYSVIVANRFAVEVSGQAASIDELKAALATGVNVAGLEAAAAAQAKPAG
jgi:Yip1 domain